MEKEKLTAAVAAMYWGANVRVNPKVLETDNYGKMMHLYNHRLSYTTPDGKRVDHVPTEDCQLEVRKLDRVDALSWAQICELMELVLDGEIGAGTYEKLVAGRQLKCILSGNEYTISALTEEGYVILFFNMGRKICMGLQIGERAKYIVFQIDIINKLRSWGVDCDGLIERGIGYSPVKTNTDDTGI